MKTPNILIALLSLALCAPVSAQKSLSKEAARAATPALVEEWKRETAKLLHAAWTEKCVRHDSLQMLFDYTIYGPEPAGGHSLFISMHGGGATTHETNNQQWDNQKRLYRPAEGIYVAPRAPWDDWNMWFKPGLDELFELLIKAAVTQAGANPDKVYLTGYSAGGDGTWRMAPRMADRWAAAAMMAGHPGEAEQVNMRNVPFMIWMGADDAAYNRNTLAAVKGEVMDSLQNADPAGYVHETHILKGKGHWMDRADTAAIAWMMRHERNPLPQKVVWRQEEVVRPYLYWIGVDMREAKPGMRVDAEIKGNTITLMRCDYHSLTLYLNDDMLNLDKPVEVKYDGKRLFKGKLTRSTETMRATLYERGDSRMIFSAGISVSVP